MTNFPVFIPQVICPLCQRLLATRYNVQSKSYEAIHDGDAESCVNAGKRWEFQPLYVPVKEL